MIDSAAEMLFVLLAVHALCDYPLQGDFLAKAKNPVAPVSGVPWYMAMGAHSHIHAGGVWLVTGSLYLALVELFLHGLIDLAKCHGKISFNTDQALHFACKFVYVLVMIWWPLP